MHALDGTLPYYGLGPRRVSMLGTATGDAAELPRRVQRLQQAQPSWLLPRRLNRRLSDPGSNTRRPGQLVAAFVDGALGGLLSPGTFSGAHTALPPPLLPPAASARGDPPTGSARRSCGQQSLHQLATSRVLPGPHSGLDQQRRPGTNARGEHQHQQAQHLSGGHAELLHGGPRVEKGRRLFGAELSASGRQTARRPRDQLLLACTLAPCTVLQGRQVAQQQQEAGPQGEDVASGSGSARNGAGAGSPQLAAAAASPPLAPELHKRARLGAGRPAVEDMQGCQLTVRGITAVAPLSPPPTQPPLARGRALYDGGQPQDDMSGACTTRECQQMLQGIARAAGWQLGTSGLPLPHVKRPLPPRVESASRRAAAAAAAAERAAWASAQPAGLHAAAPGATHTAGAWRGAPNTRLPLVPGAGAGSKSGGGAAAGQRPHRAAKGVQLPVIPAGVATHWSPVVVPRLRLDVLQRKSMAA